jgi:hypothetical protein
MSGALRFRSATIEFTLSRRVVKMITRLPAVLVLCATSAAAASLGCAIAGVMRNRAGDVQRCNILHCQHLGHEAPAALQQHTWQAQHLHIVRQSAVRGSPAASPSWGALPHGPACSPAAGQTAFQQDINLHEGHSNIRQIHALPLCPSCTSGTRKGSFWSYSNSEVPTSANGGDTCSRLRMSRSRAFSL